LALFFAHTHLSNVLFDEQAFLYNYELGNIDNALLQSILAITSLLWKNEGDTKERDHSHHVLRLNRKQILAEVEHSENASINQFQNACLMAYYGFHQCPGQKSWLEVGTLSRRAYRMGLHQLDSMNQPPTLVFTCNDEEEKESWRRIWWFIYSLDSYSNITAGTPCLLERESIRTALPRSDSHLKAENTFNPLFLDEPEVLWKIVREIFHRNVQVNQNLHIVTTTLVNEAANVQRLLNQNPTSKVQNQLFALEGHLSMIRLALAPRYLDPIRNVIQNESSSEYHARLICILHLHITRILLAMPLQVSETENDRETRWQHTLEYCSDVVGVVKQWDSANTLSVDPAICIIVFVALNLLNLQSKLDACSRPEVSTRLELDKTVLLLFLEQFGCFWELPRHLICSYKTKFLYRVIDH
jgi:hypothetical protein